MAGKRKEPLRDERMVSFEEKLAEVADILRRESRLPYAPLRPSLRAENLRSVKKLASKALAELRRLGLEYLPKGPPDASPDITWNWPLMQDLRDGVEILRGERNHGRVPKGAEPEAGYPAALIAGLTELHDAAELILKLDQPRRGNSQTRTLRQALIHTAGEHFLYQYWMHFGGTPRMSHDVLEALNRFLRRIGISDVDVAGVLRRAVDNARKEDRE